MLYISIHYYIMKYFAILNFNEIVIVILLLWVNKKNECGANLYVIVVYALAY